MNTQSRAVAISDHPLSMSMTSGHWVTTSNVKTTMLDPQDFCPRYLDFIELVILGHDLIADLLDIFEELRYFIQNAQFEF